MNSTYRLLLLAGFVTLFASCLKDKTKPFNPNGCSTIVSYSLEIEPIIHTSCMTNLGAGTGCHDAWITNYDNVKNYLDLGLWQSTVLQLKTMPKIPNDFAIDSLSQDAYHTMECWINQGYPQN